ncbi:hypothetical protein WMF45_25870 [Sorangium sp. So ce448]|uniref:hypothetical protein n=1 Tax=Sorangium sp. So ce448 TaxID=3133314 RepID=UPI003F5DCA01
MERRPVDSNVVVAVDQHGGEAAVRRHFPDPGHRTVGHLTRSRNWLEPDQNTRDRGEVRAAQFCLTP